MENYSISRCHWLQLTLMRVTVKADLYLDILGLVQSCKTSFFTNSAKKIIRNYTIQLQQYEALLAPAQERKPRTITQCHKESHKV